jgi:hypothetical protein
MFGADRAQGAVVNSEENQLRQATSAHNGARAGKLIHLALPVRLFHMKNGERGGQELACTYDIHPRGARLLSNRDVKVGDLVTVERGRLRTACQVVWAGDPGSALRGQFTVESLENGKVPWEEELRQMEEQYLPIAPQTADKPTAFRRADQNRRRGPRFRVNGEADLLRIGGGTSVEGLEGRLEQISESGCLISASDLLTPGTPLKLTLNMCDVSVALRGHVRSKNENRAMGVEFQEIRQGDRPLLDYVLTQLKQPRREDFADLEVITEHLTAVAG